MNLIDKHKIRIIVFLVTLLILNTNSSKVLADEGYLIVRVVDVDYPPLVYIFTDGHYTGFEFLFHIEIENPTQSVINVTYSCSPTPFPHLRAKLEDNSLDATISTQYEWLYPKNLTIPPGIEKRYHYSSIIILNYENDHLPLGEYELWFDYTNCSYSYVPVITQSMFIYVTENSTIFFYEYNNETEIVSTIQNTEATNFNLVFPIIPFLIVIVLYRRITKKKGCKNIHQIIQRYLIL